MKKNQVPQDDEKLGEGKTRELQYAMDENGNYTAIKSVGWEPKNIILKEEWLKLLDEIEEAKQKVIDGEVSTLYYHMVKDLLTTKMLSEYSGIPKRKVKKHLKPKYFDKLSDQTLEKYRVAFNFSTIEEVKTISNEDRINTIKQIVK